MWLIKTLEYLTNLINQGEETVINAVSTIVPWLVPVVPAYLTYSHALNKTELNFPQWVAICVGLVVESLGLTSMYRIFQFQEYNRKYKDDGKKAPVIYPIGTYVFYLVVILLVNVVLDYQNGVKVANIVAIGLLSLLSIPAGILISVQAQHTERKAEAERIRLERKKERDEAKRLKLLQSQQQNIPQQAPAPSANASQYKADIWALLDRVWDDEHRVLSPKEISIALKLDHNKAKGYISTQTSVWKQQNNIQ